jgi:epoxyqueuosine reductase
MSVHPAAELADKLKSQALRLGFCLAGITTPDPPKSLPRFEDWIAQGLHAGMDYLASARGLHRRRDPREILPDCRSILVLAMPYFPPSSSGGSVAAYAWGEDYHDTLKPLLEQLIRYLEKQTGGPVANRWYTDTGPVLERDLAHRAGLGWLGKNSMLINPRLGSYFLLAEILLGIDLLPDKPFTADHCGSCTRCIQACPTGCIRPDRTLDAGKCISYLTIENKGAIPAELRPQIGEWIFGCDVCQQVCPWNRFAPAEGFPAFSATPGFPPEDLADELSLTPEQFNRKFKGTPVKRAKRRGYLRNTAVALGSRKDPKDLPVLIQALSDPEPLVRRHAAWALGQIDTPAAATALQNAETVEKNTEVYQEISAAIQGVNRGGLDPHPN